MNAIIWAVGLVALALCPPILRAQEQLCHLRVAVAEYRLNNPSDPTNPQNFEFGSLPPVEKIHEIAAQDQSCIVPESDKVKYILVWERTATGFKGEMYEHASDEVKTIAATSGKDANEVLQTLFDSLVVYSKGLAPRPGESEKQFAARIEGKANPTCHIRLALVAYKDQEALVGALVSPQKEWLKEKAARKFPGICIDYGAPQFVFVWTQTAAVIPGFRYVWHPGTSASFDASTTDQYGNRSTTAGTVTTPGYGESVPTQELSLTAYGYLFRVSDETLLWSEWREQKAFGWASRRVLQDAYRFLAKLH